MQLYTYYRSSCAYRVRIALNFKKLPYDSVPVHLLNDGGEQHQDAYVKLNPSRQVPTLIDQGLTLGQSMAICEYLEEAYPEVPLLPVEKTERAVVRQMCEVINSGVQPLQNLAVTQYLSTLFEATNEQKKSWLKYWIERGLQSFEQLLQQNAGNHCFKDSITLADCFLVPQVFSATRFGVDIDQYPKIAACYKAANTMDAFISASPAQQSDAPSE